MTDDCKSRAQRGLAAISGAVEEFVLGQPEGARNDEVARALGLQSSFAGSHRNHLTHAILNQLVDIGKLVREKRGVRVYYVCPS